MIGVHMILKIRDPFSALSHLAGAVAALIGLTALLFYREANVTWIVSTIVYGSSLFLMFLASTLYHTFITTPKNMEILRKIDHSAIYLLIAGTYTPFCVHAFSGFWKLGLLAIIWGLATSGIVVKVFFIRAPRWLTAGVYVLMGWISVFAIQEMLSVLPLITVSWLFAGGVIYTCGAAVYVTRRMDFIPGRFGFHEVWHIFVVLGAAAHFVAVATMATHFPLEYLQ